MTQGPDPHAAPPRGPPGALRLPCAAPLLPAFLAPLLACPACGGALAPGPVGLACADACGAGPFEVRGGVPCLLPARGATHAVAAGRRTVRAFERQWRRYGRLRRLFGKDARAMAAFLTGARMGGRIDAAWYRGRTVLDAGCGHGRYLRAFRALGARAVGLDIGRGPEQAGLEPDPEGLAWVQGDVLAPPFRPASFDLVFCDGVLHHTPDPARGYAALARLLKPGGALYVWLYPREGRVREAVFGVARALTTRLPDPLLRWLCFLLAPLTLGVRSYSGTRWGRATWGECAQVVHDWLAPALQSHHAPQEVHEWARAAGLGDLEPLPVPVGFIAWRPPSPTAA